MSEQDRFNFLVDRDGFDAAIEFEKRAAIQYRIAMVECFNDERLTGAKGREWAEIYCKAARECDAVARER